MNYILFLSLNYQVDAGCIAPMCELLTVVDSQIIQVALNGLENILKAGDLDKTKPNPYAVFIEECYGLYFVLSLITIMEHPNGTFNLSIFSTFFFSFART